MTKFRKLTIALSLFCTSGLFSQNRLINHQAKDNIILYFRFDKSILDPDYMTNRNQILELDSLLRDKIILAGLDSLSITAYSSPEGNPSYNDKLALSRGKAVKEYITVKFPDVAKYPIRMNSLGENWIGLLDLVQKDNKIPFKQEVLNLLNKKMNSVQKEQYLREIGNGSPWRYIEQNLLRYLRGSTCVIFFLDEQKMAAADTVQAPVAVVPLPVIIQEPEVEPVQLLPETRIVRPLALKTNLLFDLATALNVEVEVPVAPRFSIAGEWIFPWWLWENKQNCLEVLSGNLEARYWFKPNYAKQDPALGRHNPLSGWFVGLYGGGGLYDLEWKREGYQGEFFIATGLSGGYVLPLARNISMEFSLGVGIMRTKYRHYHAQFCDIDDRWHLVKQFSGQYTWIGPTRAKISFIWYPHLTLKKKKGGNL